MNDIRIMIVGVGGQGILLASRIIGSVALEQGYDLKLSEIHGMAQRGGSVVSCIKMGEKVYSPVIEKGEADIILSFEKLEALRWLEYLKPGGRMIINKQEINPVPVLIGQAEYPEGIVKKIQGNYENIISFNALEIAKGLGNKKTVNVVLLGVLAGMLEINKKAWLKAIEKVVPSRFLEVNREAFEAGFNYRL